MNFSLLENLSSIDVEISAKSFFGIRHGLTSLQQLIWFDDALSTLRVMNDVKIQDCPKFRYRGLMLDTARHYFSIETIKRIIRGMSQVKLNRFHWHMTDSQSFPFVSKNYPEMSDYGAYSSMEVYTHDDIKSVVDFAQVHGVQVIPEIDAPAHAGNGWQWGSERGMGDLSLCINQQPWIQYCGEPNCGQLNPKNNNTYLILEKIYEELIQLTKSTDIFHMGGDEVNFECWRQHFQGEDMGKLWCEFM
jgi:hexosaminidase